MTDILIQQAPKSWRRVKIGQFFEHRSENVSDLEYAPLSVTYAGIVPQLKHVAKSGDHNNRKRVAKGDLVINSRSDRRGASGLSPLDGSVSLINIVLKPRVQNSRYFHYLLRSTAFQDEFYRFGHGIVDDLWTTRYSEMKGIWVAVPPADTQAAIVRNLDVACDRIDKLIQLKRRQIKILFEKESLTAVGALRVDRKEPDDVKATGLQWLPKMPGNWSLLRAKYVYRQITRQPCDDDEIVTAFRNGEVTLRRNRRETGYTLAVKETGYQKILPGDLVIHTMDAFAGAVGVSDSEGKATGEYAVCEAIKPNETNNEFYAEILRYMAKRDYIIVLCPSVRERAPRFRFSKFAPVCLPVPPKKEQDAIASYLLASRALRKNIEASILLLNERKAALITAAVTGQLEIPETVSVVEVSTDNVIPFPIRIAAQIIHQHKNTQKFGRVKLQKELYLAEAHAGISELQGQYERRAAGPLDQALLSRLETGLEAAALYSAHSEGSGSAVTYEAISAMPFNRADLEGELGGRTEAFFRILNKLSDLDTKSVEAIATLYAVWNDALIDGETPDDDSIIHGVLEEWHSEKKRKFKPDELRTWLGWMRRNDFVPKGQGPRTSLGRLLV